jgi:GDPmannose 4,6-dehydratase
MDITDSASVLNCLKETAPDEIYNFAAQSFVGVSFKEPLATLDITGKGPIHILDAIRFTNPKIKFYQASTSELFGKVQEIPQKETTPFYPRSPYGAAKLYAHWITVVYRESYGMFACCGILFNHESPLRGYEFVTRKITQAVARIKTGTQECLMLGNLDSKRDWGFAGDYVEGAWLMLQQEKPEEYILANHRTETVRFFVEKAFEYAGVSLKWEGKGIDEVGVDQNTNKILVKIDSKFYRPAEVDILIGDYTKAKEKLGWEPKVQLEDLIKMMVDADLQKEPS